MKFTRLDIPDVVVIEPTVFKDSRGEFFEAYHKEKYAACGIHDELVQHNQSSSVKNVLRGLHLQLKNPQGKLIRILSGEVYDVAVDVRLGSPTFKKWVSVVLSSDIKKQVYIPPGFAHGFVALSDVVQFEYKCTTLYDKLDEASILWNDPDLAIF
jgi:dTDP-4-dehydrorhamnose 3,5-epimerase